MIRVTDKGRWWMLTPHQQRIFKSLAGGLSTKETASTCSISRSAVEKHRDSIYRKTGCRTHLDICRMAIRLGLIDP